jgi:hypothetical protein
MARVSLIEVLDLDLDDVPSEILKALLAAADSILAKWSSPWPVPTLEGR